MNCPECGSDDKIEELSMWCDRCHKWVDPEDSWTMVLKQIEELKAENEELKKELTSISTNELYKKRTHGQLYDEWVNRGREPEWTGEE